MRADLRNDSSMICIGHHGFAASRGLARGGSANDLFPIALDPNVHIQEVKAATCDIRPGRRPRGPALLGFVDDYRRRAGVDVDRPHEEAHLRSSAQVQDGQRRVEQLLPDRRLKPERFTIKGVAKRIEANDEPWGPLRGRSLTGPSRLLARMRSDQHR